MTLYLVRRLAVFVLLAAFACSLAGCWNPFAPPGGGGGGNTQADYHVRLHPDDVIHNLKTAYEYRNAGEYLDCLSEDFIFYASEEDLNNPDPENPVAPEYYKPDETIMHNNMFDDGSDVEGISLALTTTNTTFDQGDPGDPDDDIWIYTEGVDLRVHLFGGLTYLATTPSEYRFRIDVDQTGPNGEVLWEIYKWFDLGPPDARVSHDPDIEHMSLAQLKHLFMD